MPGRKIVFEHAGGPIIIDPDKPDTGRIDMVHKDKEKTLTLSFPHPENVTERYSNKTAWITTPATYGFGAKSGNWHYYMEQEPPPAPISVNEGLRHFSTTELAAEVVRRKQAANKVVADDKKATSGLPATAHVDTGLPPAPSPPEPPLAQIANLERWVKEREELVRTAKLVRIKRKNKRGKLMVISKISPEKLRKDDQVVGIVKYKEGQENAQKDGEKTDPAGREEGPDGEGKGGLRVRDDEKEGLEAQKEEVVTA